jgi:hypothetical protein
MPVSSGPKTVSDSIIFNYDTGDTANSWIGAPTTNLTAFNIATSGFNTDTSGNLTQTSNSSEATYQGRLSRKMVVGAGYWNAYIYSYNTGVSSANFAVSYKVKTADGSHPNTIIGGGYIYGSAGSFFPAPTFTYVSDGWYLATILYSGTSMTLNSITGMNGSGGPKTFYIVDYQAEALPYSTPFIPAGTSRSVTQGLLDISGRGNSISLSNVSFNSSGQITFDGTDDYINIDNSSALQVGDTFTISAWVFPTNLNSRQGVFTTRRNNATGCWQLEVGTASGGINRVAVTGIGTWIFETPDNIISPNTWTNICFVKSGNGIQGGTLYVNGVAISPQVTTAYNIANNSDAKVVGAGTSLGSPFPGRIANVALYNRILTSTEVANNYIELRKRFDAPIYTYSEGNSASSYVSNWNNSTTYTMADFGGIPNVNAHGFSSGPVTFTLTLNNLPPHTRIRYKVLWHLVDSLDNETNQLFIMNSGGGETEILRFTKQYNLTPAISIAASPGTYTWSGAKSYTYRPWAGGAYGADGYIVVDSGLIDHTLTSFTARHVMGADQGQSDEAEYLSHVLVELY